MPFGHCALRLGEFVFEAEPPELHDRAGAPVALRPRTLLVLQCLARRGGGLVGKTS